MNKKFFGIFCVLFVGIAIIISTNKAEAGELFNDKNLEIGAYGALVVPSKSNFDSTGGGGGYLRYRMTEKLSLEASAEYDQWDFTTDVTGATGNLTGTIDVLPIMGSLLYYFSKSDNFSAYVGGGITGMLIDGNATGTLNPGDTGTISFDNAVGGHLSLGLDWGINDNISFNLDGKYTFAESKTSETLEDTNYVLTFEDMDMSNFTMRGGLSYKF